MNIIGSIGRIKVTTSEFKGAEYVDIRQYYDTLEGKEAPSKKGITISVAILPKIVELLSGLCSPETGLVEER